MFAVLFGVVLVGIIIVSAMAHDSKTIDIVGNYQENRENEANMCAISFPEYDPEEYQRQKREKNDKALNGCEFWDGLNIDFQENLQLLNYKKCPYCSCNLPERKGKSYKCPECKGKIYRLKDLVSDFEGLFTEQQKEIREQLKNEINRRKRFLEIYENAKNYINFVPTNFKNDNIIILLGLLQEASLYTKKKGLVNKLRMCRFYEAQLCMNIKGYEKAGLNAFLAVAYIDLWGNRYFSCATDEEYLAKKYDDICVKHAKWLADKNKKEFDKEKFLESRTVERMGKAKGFYCDGKIAPYIIEEIRKFNYNIGILKGLFIGHAKGITKSIQYKPPITPEEAWEKFYNQYTK
jgi:hypothetical protein